MALNDVTYYDGGAADLVIKLDPATYVGVLKDISEGSTYIYGLSLTGGGGATDYAFGG